MNEIIFNTTLIRGAKGATGQGENFEVPAGTIIAYDGNDIPEGWVETTAPEGMGGSDSYIPITATAEIEMIGGIVE